MDLRTLVAEHHRSLQDAFLAWRSERSHRALVDLIGSVTAYVVAAQRVLTPATEGRLDVTLASEHAREHARARVLLLRLCALKKLGSARLESTITELQGIVTHLGALDARAIAPELERLLPLDVAASVAHDLQVEHDAAARAFGKVAARARAAEAQASEYVASAAE